MLVSAGEGTLFRLEHPPPGLSVTDAEEDPVENQGEGWDHRDVFLRPFWASFIRNA